MRVSFQLLAKLSQRLSRFRGRLLLGGAVLAACSTEQSVTAPSSLDPHPAGSPRVAVVLITPPVDSGPVGSLVRLSAVARDREGRDLPGRAILWESLTPAVASVDASGLVALMAPGEARIRATSDGVAGTATIVVVDSLAADSTATRPPQAGGPPAGYFADVNGSSAGDGTIGRPWDLATALAGGHGTVQPGDTVWIRGGTYRGTYISTVSGAIGRPVVVRQYPGERAIIDAAGAGGSTLLVKGPYSVFWGFELTNSDPVRTTASTGNHSRSNTLVNDASDTKFIHLTVHDGGVGFYNYPSASNVEVYGSILYNNGWQAPDRGHGHGLYVKSDVGPVTLRENVLFNQFGYGIHAHSNATSGNLIDIRMEANVAFNNGTISSNSTSPNILLGGYSFADQGLVRGNYTYYSPGAGGTNVRIGFGSTRNGGVRVEDNTFVGGTQVLEMGFWSSPELRDNVLVGSGTVVALQDSATAAYQWNRNRSHRDPSSSAWRVAGASLTWIGWLSTTGLGGSDQVIASPPATTRVIVQPSAYERGRAQIVVYNWDRSGAVTVDLGGILPPGSQYTVHNVQDLFGAPVVTGTYAGGGLTLPLVAVQPPPPVGMAISPAPSTGIEFSVFVVTVAR